MYLPVQITKHSYRLFLSKFFHGLVNKPYLWAFLKTNDFKSKVINYAIFGSIIKLAEVDFQFTFSIALNIMGLLLFQKN